MSDQNASDTRPKAHINISNICGEVVGLLPCWTTALTRGYCVSVWEMHTKVLHYTWPHYIHEATHHCQPARDHPAAPLAVFLLILRPLMSYYRPEVSGQPVIGK